MFSETGSNTGKKAKKKKKKAKKVEVASSDSEEVKLLNHLKPSNYEQFVSISQAGPNVFVSRNIDLPEGASISDLDRYTWHLAEMSANIIRHLQELLFKLLLLPQE